ncbi:hypothetical protein ACS0TY_006928 [Phlomoides rotata]
MDTANSSSGDEARTCYLANTSDPSVFDLIKAEKSPMQWKKAARKRKGKKVESNSCCDETRWDFYRKEKEITEEVIKAWEVGQKLGLYSKCSDEDIRRQLEIMEHRDIAKGNRNIRKGRRDPRSVMSFNIRGAGKIIKRNEIRSLVCSYGIDMCCVQETKLEKFDVKLGRSLWGNNDCEWAYREAVGRISSWHINGMLVVNGRWIDGNVKVVIINVYAPCSIPEKQLLWEAINIVVEQSNDRKICVVGDFNSIREANKRVVRRIHLFEWFVRPSSEGQKVHVVHARRNLQEQVRYDVG